MVYIKLFDLSYDEAENVRMNWELAKNLLKLHRASRTALVVFF
jgi:hypothetical protein